jgi:hypothetical protein
MTLTDATFDTTQRCSLFSRVSGDDPIGQARTYAHQLFLEAPLPWDFDFTSSTSVPDAVAEVLQEANERKIDVALLGMVPDDGYAQVGLRRVLHFRRPEGPFARFEKDDYLVSESEVAGLLRALLLDPNALHGYQPFRQESADVRELFVCTHGARDACCGTFGYPVYERLRRDYATRPENGMRVWRTSHTGGHRFAPTLLDFPEGRYWAQLDEELLDMVVHRQGPVKNARSHMRGWSGFGRMEQVVDREILMREGWKWMDYAKRGTTTAAGRTYTAPTWLNDVEEAEVSIDFISPDGADSGTYTARLIHTGEAPFGGCGKPLKMERQFSVVQIQKMAR